MPRLAAASIGQRPRELVLERLPKGGRMMQNIVPFRQEAIVANNFFTPGHDNT